MDEFNRLKDEIDLSNFRREAALCLEDLYEKHKRQQGAEDHLESLLSSNVKVGPIISAEIVVWLKCIYRRMVYTPRIHKPWCIEIKRDMTKEIFQSFQGGIKGETTSFGLTVEADEIKFHDARRLVRDFSKLSGISRSEIKSKFKKVFKGKHFGCRAELLVTADKPFVVSYDKKMEVKVSCSFGCWDQFGYDFHS